MSEPNFRPWTLAHSVWLALACVLLGLAWWYLPRVSWLSDFFGAVLPSPATVWKVRDPSLHGRGLSVHPRDGSIYVVGDSVEPPSGPDRVSYVGSFIARYASDGSQTWKRILDDDGSVVHDVTTLSDGQACALSHHYQTFDNGRVRCFDASGSATADYALTVPRSTRVLVLPDDSLVLGGAEVLSWHDGLAHSAGWLGELRSGRLHWTAKRVGRPGGVSEVRALARGPEGEIITGGSLGRGPHVSQPWLAKWAADGKLIWSEVMPCYVWAHQTVNDVSITASGEILAAGFCDYPWVRRYSKDGHLRAEHRFAARDYPTTLYATDRGYVVGSTTHADQWGQLGNGWNIRGVSAAGFPLWTIHRGGCQELQRVRPAASGAVIALGFCAYALVVAQFAPP